MAERLYASLMQAGYPARTGSTANAEHARKVPSIPVGVLSASRPAHQHEPLVPCAAGLLGSAMELSRYELLVQPPEQRMPLLPQMADIPAMWLGKLRAYHHSTCKELLERAVEWQMPVQLKLKDGLRAFVPEKLLEHADKGWAVKGRLRDNGLSKPVVLTPDSWDELKLLVPE
ncbi:hypothetical protein [Paenibacillus protaetiae]|uniref:Uncharacterized protein n=1 Tax=Paenibacillus protaetiae TaxID=2509456 RepID=A0A4V0YEV2_9BACL|nr:hypothetical protein [Paenibacillus protaetiae]QAY65501.1 hypothetical protein ET464_03010 [Paenibacillus protaetiae]